MSLSESFVNISTFINFRKTFLRGKIFENLVKNALKLGESITDFSSRQALIGINCIKVIMNVCSLSGTRGYIPGETNIAEQLRKRSFDCGCYVLLVYVSSIISTTCDLRNQIE